MDVMDGLVRLPEESVHCVVTSPPYFQQRNYGIEGQIGLEKTVDEYVEKMVNVFREVRRVLRKDSSAWLNLGDSFNSIPGGYYPDGEFDRPYRKNQRIRGLSREASLKPKDLLGVPWRTALALQADGWWLRSDIIWHKPAPLPESVKDRPTRSHEYIFLLTKSKQYFYDSIAVREDPAESSLKRINQSTENFAKNPGRNLRDVWTMATGNYSGGHYATFPLALPEICIKAGTSERGVCPECGSPWKRILSRGVTDHSGETESTYAEGSNANRLAKLRQAARDRGEEYINESKTIGWEPTCYCNRHKLSGNDKWERIDGKELQPLPATVLDPFSGHSASGLVAARLGRSYIGIEINPEDCEASKRRIEDDAPLFNRVEIKK